MTTAVFNIDMYMSAILIKKNEDAKVISLITMYYTISKFALSSTTPKRTTINYIFNNEFVLSK